MAIKMAASELIALYTVRD